MNFGHIMYLWYNEFIFVSLKILYLFLVCAYFDLEAVQCTVILFLKLSDPIPRKKKLGTFLFLS